MRCACRLPSLSLCVRVSERERESGGVSKERAERDEVMECSGGGRVGGGGR